MEALLCQLSHSVKYLPAPPNNVKQLYFNDHIFLCDSCKDNLAHLFGVPPLCRCIMACHGKRDLRLTDTFSGDVTELL